ncbi:lipoate protein ligase C-terminal domain-containing protein, partial [Erysipelothrix rhusiopathiae]|nr:lipoate protein ligase C-terminal domain-containing protein [Erysipelothrix rhusiopathiae]
MPNYSLNVTRKRISFNDIADVEGRLQGTRFKQSDVDAVLSEMDLRKYFGIITKEELLEL